MKTAVAAGVAASILATTNYVAASNVILPPDVHPLTRQETVNIYSGKTINYPGFSYYFRPNGSLVGVTKNRRSSGQGTWAVDGNTVCVRSVWRNRRTSKSARYHVCYAWYADDAAYWTKITKGEFAGNVYRGNPALVAAGDRVSGLAAKVRSSHRR